MHDEPLDQLTDAVLAAEALGEVADHLIGHFVDQARRSGASWTEIGKCMGVTKQAAQKRFVPTDRDQPMDPNDGFSRFTPRARNVVVAGPEQGTRRGQRRDHARPTCCSALFADPASLAVAPARRRRASTPTRAANAVTLPPRRAEVPALVPFNGPAKKVLELTFREALRLGHNYIGTEHILLALLEAEDDDGPLHTLGVDKDGVEADIAEVLRSLTDD